MPVEHAISISVAACTNISPFPIVIDPSFKTQVVDSGTSSSLDLTKVDLLFLHECLEKFCHESGEEPPSFPNIPKYSTNVVESLETCRIHVESYLQSVLAHPECVGCPQLWIVLQSSPESHIVPRFLARRDNLEEILDLTELPAQLPRVSTAGVISTILRLLEENPFTNSIQSAGLSAISRLSCQLRQDQSKLLSDTKVVGTLFRLLSSGSLLIHLVRPVLLSIVEIHPITMFVYLQRDGGLVELAEMVSSDPSPNALSIIAETVYTATRFSNDVCIAISDKSSVGVSLLNKLLAKGQGTHVEVIVTTTLVNLLRKGFITEYKEKISKVIVSIISSQKFYLQSNFFCPYKLANSTLHGPILDDVLIQFGCFLIANRALNGFESKDDDWALNYDENGTTLFQKRLIQLLVTGTSLTEMTKWIISETYLLTSSPNRRVRKIEEIREYFSQIKIWNKYFSWKFFNQKINFVSNSLIEINFQISSKSAGVQSDDILSIQRNLDAIGGGVDRLKQMAKKISLQIFSFENNHKKLVDNVLSTMNQLRVLTNDATVVRNKLLSTLTFSDEETAAEKIESELDEIDSRLKQISTLVERKEELEFEIREATTTIQEKSSLIVSSSETPSEAQTVTEDSADEKSDVGLLKNRLEILQSQLPNLTDELMRKRSSLDEFVFSASIVKSMESVAMLMEDLKRIHYDLYRINSTQVAEFLSQMESLDQEIADIHQQYRVQFREELFRVKHSLENVIDIVEEGSGDSSGVGGFITPDEGDDSG